MRTETISVAEPATEPPIVHVTLCAVCEKRIVYADNHLKVRRAGRDYPVCSATCAKSLEQPRTTNVMVA
jgi:hypothetical protein